jgi:hypothetical protein
MYDCKYEKEYRRCGMRPCVFIRILMKNNAIIIVVSLFLLAVIYYSIYYGVALKVHKLRLCPGIFRRLKKYLIEVLIVNEYMLINTRKNIADVECDLRIS